MTTWLTSHFSLEEMVASQTAARKKIDNTPSHEVYLQLATTARHMEKVRDLLGDNVISISSGYRSPALNAAVGGSATSGHMKGYAVDFTCRRYGDPFDVCMKLAKSDLQFDQLLMEGSWTHISFDPRMRRQALTKAGKSFTKGISK